MNMRIEVRKVSNGYIIVTKNLEPGYNQYTINNLVEKEFIATTLDGAMDKLRELLQ